MAAGLGEDGRGYLLEDGSLKGSSAEWVAQVVALFHRHRADRVVAETNYGGQMVEALLRTADRSIPYRAVTATRGKQVRAEPVAALYEKAQVSHCGPFPALEDELCSWVPGEASPNRLDAAVWAFTELMIQRVWELHVW